MSELSNITVAEIHDIMTVYSPRGRRFHMEARPYCGISFCKSGKITYNHNGKLYVSEPNSVVFLPGGATYDLYGNETGYFPIINFIPVCTISGEFVCLPLSDPASCLHLFDALAHAYVYENNNVKVMRLTYELLETADRGSDSVIFDLLKPAEAYIKEHIYSPELKISAIASSANISEVYFRKLFTDKHNTTPRRYIIRTRVEHAKQELLSTHKSITEISADCGFSDVFHFCRTFREAVGVTPGEYRRSASKL